MIENIRRYPQILYFTGFLLLIPALLINLGKLNIFFAVDEATRALVALEMMINDNYITPTLNGEFYYNKPPLFSWILVLLFKKFGISELVLRLPTVLSVFGFGITIYVFVSRELGRQAGILTAFLFISCGRLLYWESWLGYIDTTFSWVSYCGMMLIIYYFRKKKYLRLFMISYFLMTLGFMLKGLPAIAFQGITLLVVFISEKQFKQLFTWKHFAGIMVFVLLTGGYYLIYHQYNTLENLFSTLLSESSNRMEADKGLWHSIKHIVLFPGEMFYHYLPWTILIGFTFTRGFREILSKNKFLKLNFLVFMFNLVPYWISPDVYPKYIMMLLPMVLTVALYFYIKNKSENRVASKVFETILLGVASLLTLGFLAFPFLPVYRDVPGAVGISLVLFGLAAIFTFLFWKIKNQRLMLFVIILIVGRLALGFFIWPERGVEFEIYEKQAIEVARITKDEPVFYYHAKMTQYGASYVMSREKWDIIRIEKSEPKPGIYYITDNEGLRKIEQHHKNVDVFYNYKNVEDGRNLNLVKIYNND